MKTIKILSSLAAGLALSLPQLADAQANLGQSSAQDISAEVNVTGTLGPIPILGASLDLGPVNSASGVAPAPYSDSPGVIVDLPLQAADLLSLNLDVAVDSLTATSDVNALPGPRGTSGVGEITSAGVSLGLAVPLVPQLTNLLTINVVANDPLVALTTNSATAWDGTQVTAAASSNLLTTSTVTVSVLGVPIFVPALSAGVTANLPINVPLLPLGSVTGNISLTPDLVISSGPDATSATASATALAVGISLSVDVLGTIEADVNGNVAINSTSAAMSAVPVPEPTGAALALAGAMVAGLRRRRA